MATFSGGGEERAGGKPAGPDAIDRFISAAELTERLFSPLSPGAAPPRPFPHMLGERRLWIAVIKQAEDDLATALGYARTRPGVFRLRAAQYRDIAPFFHSDHFNEKCAELSQLGDVPINPESIRQRLRDRLDKLVCYLAQYAPETKVDGTL